MKEGSNKPSLLGAGAGAWALTAGKTMPKMRAMKTFRPNDALETIAIPPCYTFSLFPLFSRLEDARRRSERESERKVPRSMLSRFRLLWCFLGLLVREGNEIRLYRNGDKMVTEMGVRVDVGSTVVVGSALREPSLIDLVAGFGRYDRFARHAGPNIVNGRPLQLRSVFFSLASRNRYKLDNFEFISNS